MCPVSDNWIALTFHFLHRCQGNLNLLPIASMKVIGGIVFTSCSERIIVGVTFVGTGTSFIDLVPMGIASEAFIFLALFASIFSSGFPDFFDFSSCSIVGFSISRSTFAQASAPFAWCFVLESLFHWGWS